MTPEEEASLTVDRVMAHAGLAPLPEEKAVYAMVLPLLSLMRDQLYTVPVQEEL